jgi:histidinol dehydrogenase
VSAPRRAGGQRVRTERIGQERLGVPGGIAAVARRMHALVPSAADVEEPVRAIVADVRARGDAAVLDCTRRFDTGGAEPRELVVAAHELDEAMGALSSEVYAGLETAIANVAQTAAAAVREDVTVRLRQGQRVLVRELPVSSAAVYVPGGRAAYPTTVVMGTVTARAAGVLDVVVCSPPRRDGQIDATVLAACRLCGVTRVYRMGGAHAIAALALGTDTVAPVDMIAGPGNLYVQEAKRQLSGSVGVDGFAGPSDLLVILGDDADAGLAALDLAAQAEHGEGTLVAALSPSAEVLDAVGAELERIEGEGAPIGGAVCVLVHTADPRQALALANEFAPEHLQLVGAGVESLAGGVRAAGCLFVGAASATAFGDYVAGSNHVLPTGGAARFSAGLSVASFRRPLCEVHIEADAAAELAELGAPVALAEGFPLHARSMLARAGRGLAPGDAAARGAGRGESEAR